MLLIRDSRSGLEPASAYVTRKARDKKEEWLSQIENNSPEQAMLGDFASALDDAVMESSEAHHSQMHQVLSNKELAAGFGRIVFDMLVAQMKGLTSERSTPVPPSR